MNQAASRLSPGTSNVRIPRTDLSVFPLCLGGNVFGWSADEEQSDQVLDEFFSLGGNFIDTADMYSEWKEGNIGGESERIIGNWMAKKKNRNQVVIATKVAKYSQRLGLSAVNIRAAVDDSLKRLQTEYIDIYYAHEDDEKIPLEETLGAFTEIVSSGKVHYIAASNYSGARLQQAHEISQKNNFAEYVAVQNRYNLLDRKDFESEVVSVLNELGISGIPFYGLARGFLSGKYQPGAVIESVRAGGVKEYQNDHGWALLARVRELAEIHKTSPSAIALAWLRSQLSISVPIASARTVGQLNEIMEIVHLRDEEITSLSYMKQRPR